MIKLKKLLEGRYKPPTSSDTFQDIFLNVVKSLEDLQDLFKQYSPEERQVIKMVERYDARKKIKKVSQR